MSARELPVTIAVERAGGQVEHVRVGTAYPAGDGFRLRLNELFIGGSPMKPAASDPVFTPPPRRSPPPGGGAGETVFPNYGRSKGAPIHGASMGDLEFYANGARRSLSDASKSRWHDRERALLAAIEAEIARQEGGGRVSPQRPDDAPWEPPMPSGPSYNSGPPEVPEPPAFDDEDIPF